MSTPQQAQQAHSKHATLVSAAPRFLVEDMEQALAFYGQLGFQTAYSDGGFAIVSRDSVDMHLNASDGPMTSHGVCWMSVTSIDSLYQEYVPTNAVRSQPTEQPWGLKEFYIEDPWCNLILFAEPLADDGTGAATPD
jgi:hypothetical protein